VHDEAHHRLRAEEVSGEHDDVADGPLEGGDLDAGQESSLRLVANILGKRRHNLEEERGSRGHQEAGDRLRPIAGHQPLNRGMEGQHDEGHARRADQREQADPRQTQPLRPDEAGQHARELPALAPASAGIRLANVGARLQSRVFLGHRPRHSVQTSRSRFRTDLHSPPITVGRGIHKVNPEPTDCRPSLSGVSSPPPDAAMAEVRSKPAAPRERGRFGLLAA
jgi:hypothetical protein